VIGFFNTHATVAAMVMCDPLLLTLLVAAFSFSNTHFIHGNKHTPEDGDGVRRRTMTDCDH
jgi:hypothetical protein